MGSEHPPVLHHSKAPPVASPSGYEPCLLCIFHYKSARCPASCKRSDLCRRLMDCGCRSEKGAIGKEDKAGQKAYNLCLHCGSYSRLSYKLVCHAGEFLLYFESRKLSCRCGQGCEELRMKLFLLSFIFNIPAGGTPGAFQPLCRVPGKSCRTDKLRLYRIYARNSEVSVGSL